MKAVNVLLLVFFLVCACSSPKKAPTKENKPKISHADILMGGTSFSNPIVIKVRTETAGLAEEYKWLSISYPGYKLIRRTNITRSSRQYDIVRIHTKQGQVKDIYFDSTSFWGHQ